MPDCKDTSDKMGCRILGLKDGYNMRVPPIGNTAWQRGQNPETSPSECHIDALQQYGPAQKNIPEVCSNSVKTVGGVECTFQKCQLSPHRFFSIGSPMLGPLP